jgi:HAD superfamily hydrolase (TIGR01509 family)
MSAELIIFDCDGVLVDSEAITSGTLAECLRDAGAPWTAEHVSRRYRGVKLPAILADAETALGAALPEDFVERFRARLYRRLRRDTQPIPGIAEALDALRVPVCVASNGPREKMEATLGATGLMDRFADRLFSGWEVGSFKPDPGLFLHAAVTLGAAPERCVVVEDSDPGVEAAENAGMRVLAYVGLGAHITRPGAECFDSMARLPELLVQC